MVRPIGPAVLEAYPKELTLDDGTVVTVRPLRREDEAALIAFFQGIPEEDRFYLKEDVGDPAVVRRWVAELDYDRVLPLVALRDGEIVADATLHRRGWGARRHLGEVRMVVAPKVRRKGLALAMMGELVEIAAAVGLERLETEIVAGAEMPAFEVVQQAGFEQAAVIPDHFKGPDGRPHDLMILVLPLVD
ncbi:MAG TPA: GNAT family N-acetyltransferase [Dehalococcoidia bacterium]